MKEIHIETEMTETKTALENKTNADVQNESMAAFHSNFSIGGPMSAFSSIGPSDGPRSIFKPYSLCEGDFPAIKYEDPLLQTTIYSRRDMLPELPIAPAFAQIFQRRRRLESRPRRQRTTFTSDQTLKLELEYNRADYITRPRRFELAELLSLTESQIKIWFQNRRAKDKRIEKAHMDHQLRAMGYNNMASPVPLSVAYKNMYGPCGVPPISTHAAPLLYGGNVKDMPLTLL